MPALSKKEADAYDKILDAAADLAALIERGAIRIDADDLEELTIYLARNARRVKAILLPAKRARPFGLQQFEADL
jgi:dsDNA-binding SOS-regulon protein